MRRKLQILLATLIACGLISGPAVAAAAPSVVAGDTSSIRDTSAVLHATINPNGSATTYYFQWGSTSAYGSSGKLKSLKSGGSYPTPVDVSGSAKHLTPGTTYHYQLVATNKFGTTDGADRTFTTNSAPIVSTGPATELSTSSATLSGAVNPSGRSTSWYFEWGAGSLSEQTIPQTIGSGSSAQSVSWSLRGLLRPGTIYRYRLVAAHSKSHLVEGSVQTFMTYPSAPFSTHVNAHTAPRHARRRPYTFTTAGAVIHPSSIPGKYVCAGEVTIQFVHRRHRVRYNTATVRRDCRFSATTAFHHLPGFGRWRRPVRLRVVVRFMPTRYLATSRARTEHVKVG